MKAIKTYKTALASVFVVMGLSIALILGGCTAKKSTDAKNSASKTIQLSLADDVKSLDPSNAFDSVSLSVMPLVMESLFQYSYLKRPLQLEPLLAESMPLISADKKTYTIKIKKGVKFQDDPAFVNGKGRELVASDFLYGWKRMLLPENHSNGIWIFEDKVVGYAELKKKIAKAAPEQREKLLNTEIEGMKALDKYTIQIKVAKPYPQLLYVLAMGFGAPVAPESTAKYGHVGLVNHMVGTGPYKLESYVPNSKLVLVKNANFREELFPADASEEAIKRGLTAYSGKKLPFADRVVFRILKEDQPRWLEFNKGNLDIAGIPKDNFDTAINALSGLSNDLKSKGIQLQTYDRSVIWYVNFNMKDPILGKNANLRRAIVRAIDRDYMIKIFLNGRGKKATSIVPPGISGHIKRDGIVGDFNLEEAKKYLAAAGYPEGKGLGPINFDLRGASTTTRQQGEYIKKALAKIGVKINVIANTFPAYLEKERTGNLQFFFGGWAADYPDPENFMQLLYSKNTSPGPNASNYKNEIYDDLYLKAAAMDHSNKKEQVIREAEDMVFNDAIWSMLYYPKAYLLSHKWLKNYYPNELINNGLKYLDVDMKERKQLLDTKF